MVRYITVQASRCTIFRACRYTLVQALRYTAVQEVTALSVAVVVAVSMPFHLPDSQAAQRDTSTHPPCSSRGLADAFPARASADTCPAPSFPIMRAESCCCPHFLGCTASQRSGAEDYPSEILAVGYTVHVLAEHVGPVLERDVGGGG